MDCVLQCPPHAREHAVKKVPLPLRRLCSGISAYVLSGLAAVTVLHSCSWTGFISLFTLLGCCGIPHLYTVENVLL